MSLRFKDISSGYPPLPDIAKRANRFLLANRKDQAAQAVLATNSEDSIGQYLGIMLLDGSRKNIMSIVAQLQSLQRQLIEGRAEDGVIKSRIEKLHPKFARLAQDMYTRNSFYYVTCPEVCRLYQLEKHQLYFASVNVGLERERMKLLGAKEILSSIDLLLDQLIVFRVWPCLSLFSGFTSQKSIMSPWLK